MRALPLICLTLVAACSVPAANARDAGARAKACAARLTATERAICNNRDLTRRDAVMNEDWVAIRKVARRPVFDDIRYEQRLWLKERDACGTDAACIAGKYADRGRFLKDARNDLTLVRKHLEE